MRADTAHHKKYMYISFYISIFSVQVVFSFQTLKNPVLYPKSTHVPVLKYPTLNHYHQLQLAGSGTCTMSWTFWLFSRHTTTIILVDSLSNLNMIQGDLHHINWSTTIMNRDAFDIVESTVTTTPPGKVVIGASRTLIYSGYIQHQPPWYFQIPPPRVMNMIQAELQVLQVRDKF